MNQLVARTLLSSVAVVATDVVNLTNAGPSDLEASAPYTAAETARFTKGYKRQPWSEIMEMNVSVYSPEANARIPNALDWTKKHATSQVFEQGECGACWAFSTITTVESAVFMSTGKLPEALSVEELLDCNKNDDDAGCDGGDVASAVSFLKKNGVSSEANYRYTAGKGGHTKACTWNKKSIVTVTSMQYAVPHCHHSPCDKDHKYESVLASALAKHGPLAICINSGEGQTGDWMKYKGGILKGECTAEAHRIDHCVQLVGYDKSQHAPYWKIRNTWGTKWGEGGYIRLPYSKNYCCVGCEAVIIHATSKNQLDELIV